MRRLLFLKRAKKANMAQLACNVTKWLVTGEDDIEGHHSVNATAMVVNNFPLFLERPVRMTKTTGSVEAEQMYDKIQLSGLNDRGLGMYTLSAR
jgi:hypothetical protein